MEKSLIEYHKLERIYTITEKGVHFLDVYNQFNQSIANYRYIKDHHFNRIPNYRTFASNKRTISYLATYNKGMARTNNIMDGNAKNV
jgi:hypothetical protein